MTQDLVIVGGSIFVILFTMAVAGIRACYYSDYLDQQEQDND